MDKIQKYVENIDEKWQDSYQRLATVIAKNIPEGFVLRLQYGMPTYAVPLSVFPEGYLGRKDEPLPFISLASQKKHLSLYHMGIMGDKELLAWFQEEYQKVVPTKLNMGKSCIRFSNPKNIPYELIGELVSKISMEEWVASYTRFTEKNKK
ncbi:DUF1801 domain-containing protein [Enterococcus caccae]|uniref:YdhG-like domain-containing protein n=1 Tax=Enterococcus caccae ATCC BAA-1240 TaxID=1158612 RepID=R3TY74_9ENTE|nr:DUF1801 domain-containing protein [Enterococcus caccae]EOL46529.1 hypothetical protein UC7_01498 [Enterococcus caccae ATCC BAA-1240]EOT60898.1 hypothetical protein I580_01800 [Enterococcus caccae ATCC BAA-1240]OJG26227.1 hypothetical protein RU98_GL000729 [Enterococcus caccae]